MRRFLWNKCNKYYITLCLQEFEKELKEEMKDDDDEKKPEEQQKSKDQQQQ